MDVNTIIQGDALEVLSKLPDASIQCCVTSPPYFGLRDYGVENQIGLEETPEKYVSKLVEVFREVKRILRDDGVLWLNLGDSYAGSWGNYAPRGIKGEQRPQTEEGKRWEREAYSDTSFLPPTANPSRYGLKPKDLIGIPWMVAFALRADGWYLRSDIIWAKSNCMPESVEDRPTKSHEYIFLLSKNDRYYYDADAIRESHTSLSGEGRMTGGRKHLTTTFTTPENGKYADKQLHSGDWTHALHPLGRNKRTVWTVASQPYSEAHFATFPPKLIEPCILAGSQPNDIILDPFMGAGTVALVAIQHGRNYLGIELNPSYVQLAEKRIATVQQNLWTSGSEAIAV